MNLIHALRPLGSIILLAIALVVIVSLGPAQTSLAQSSSVGPKISVQAVQVSPDPPDALTRPQPQISAQELEKFQAQRQKLRVQMAAAVNQNPHSPQAPLPPVASPPSSVAAAPAVAAEAPQYPGDPSLFVIGRNNKNTRANAAGLGSTLAEPSAANDGLYVFASGNLRHAEYSRDGGSTWTNVTIPGGPTDAPTAWGDTDVLYDEATGVTFWSQLYIQTNPFGSNGVVRIFVRRTVNGATSCSYTIDPAGASNNTLPDYPKLHKSNNYLYLSTNNLGGAAGGRADILRLSIDQMAKCVTAGGALWSLNWNAWFGGQRVVTPVEGARESMYFAALLNTSTLRVFSWGDDNSTNVVDKSISTSTFGAVDCRGGTSNNNWWDSLTANIVGFNLRGAVGAGRLSFWWNVAPDASHPQGHIHGAILRESDFSLLTQPVIWNSNYCFGNAVVTVNDRGDIGMTLAVGGMAGGGGAAARPAVSIDDDFTSGLGWFGIFHIIAAGTENRADARYGDYFVIHRQTPCGLWFESTGYALNGGTALANVNSRYVEFGRGRDQKCYYGWRGKIRTP